MSQSGQRKKYLDYLLLNIAMIIILAAVLKVNMSMFKFPVDYRGDFLQVLFYFKLVITGDQPFWTYAASQSIGQPLGYIGADFPTPVASNFLFARLLGLFSSNAFLVTNLYILTSYFMIINMMYYVLDKLKVNNFLAITVALLYALIPYHHLRMSHTWFINYFLLPISIYYLLLLWRSKPLFFIKKPDGSGYKFDFSSKNLIIIAVLILFSVWNFYYTFFFVLLAIATTISAVAYRRTRQHLYSGLMMIFFVTAPFVLNLIPFQLYQAEHGKNPFVAKREIRESEIYGLKIAQMLLPINGHNNAYFAKIKDRYAAAPLINENATATLGLVGAIGFLILTIYILFNERVFSVLKKLSIMSYTALVIGTIGGYSSLFALLVTPQIRGYSRISIYIATIVLIAFAIALTQLMRRYKFNQIAAFAISLAILLIGIYDQVPSYISYSRAIEVYKANFLIDQMFIKEIEKELASENNKRVFQLPHMQTPEGGAIKGIGEYEQAVGYLHSDQIKWSYGAVKGRQSEAWIMKLLQRPLEEQVDILKSSGFNGIYIDRRGYDNNAKELEENLSKLLNTTPIISKNGIQSFFKMQPTGNKTYEFPPQ